jgi:hypothetical protein
MKLVHDPDGLVLAGPEPSMRKRLENAVRRSMDGVRVIDAGAEWLPFAGATLDTGASTLVLCTVDAARDAPDHPPAGHRPGHHRRMTGGPHPSSDNRPGSVGCGSRGSRMRGGMEA